VEVEGYPGKLKSEDITGVVIYSRMERTGSFATSSSDLNALEHNIEWSMKGNFVSIPTDCPQRDERLGWTGDAQIFSATAMFLMDTDQFFRQWLRDLKLDQTPAGAVPWMIPDLRLSQKLEVLQGNSPKLVRGAGTAGWGDAATVIPWNLYLMYGDKEVLSEQYDSMVRWVEYEKSRTEHYIWNRDFQFGDWLDYFRARQRSQRVEPVRV
jgi:alpha-L-rhamnosidase